MIFYDPARIAELSGQGLDNREIGEILREGAMIGASEAVDHVPLSLKFQCQSLTWFPAPATNLQVSTVNITAQSVSVSGGCEWSRRRATDYNTKQSPGGFGRRKSRRIRWDQPCTTQR